MLGSKTHLQALAVPQLYFVISGKYPFFRLEFLVVLHKGVVWRRWLPASFSTYKMLPWGVEEELGLSYSRSWQRRAQQAQLHYIHLLYPLK